MGRKNNKLRRKRRQQAKIEEEIKASEIENAKRNESRVQCYVETSEQTFHQSKEWNKGVLLSTSPMLDEDSIDAILEFVNDPNLRTMLLQTMSNVSNAVGRATTTQIMDSGVHVAQFVLKGKTRDDWTCGVGITRPVLGQDFNKVPLLEGETRCDERRAAGKLYGVEDAIHCALFEFHTSYIIHSNWSGMGGYDCANYYFQEKKERFDKVKLVLDFEKKRLSVYHKGKAIEHVNGLVGPFVWAVSSVGVRVQINETTMPVKY